MIWSCHAITHLAADYLERRLAMRRRMAVLMHILMCKGCRAYVEQLRLTLRALRAIPAAPVPGDAMSQLLQAFEEQRGRK